MKKLLLVMSAALIMSSAFAGKKQSLKDAVMGQNIDLTKKALDEGADPNESWSSAPALYWAAIQGRIDVMKLLIEKGAVVDGTGLMGITPLGGIAEHSKSPEEYVAENAKLNEKILKNFTEEKAREKGWYKETDITKFSTAAERAKVLIEAGADPNYLLGNGTVKEWTPFLTAVDKGYNDLVKAMLETKKVNGEIRFNQWVEGVLKFVAYVKNDEFQGWDKADVAKWSTISKENTPLLFAIEKNNLELVKILVEGGVDMNNGKKNIKSESVGSTVTTTYSYKRPLDVAVDLGYTDIIEYLKSKGAVRNQQ